MLLGGYGSRKISLEVPRAGGRAITVGDEEWVEMRGSYGVPEEQARFLVGILHAGRAG